MSLAAQHLNAVAIELGHSWIPDIYRERVLKLRTRAYQFPALPKIASAEIHHTLLGIELKVGRSRMLCPDLATARYLAVFARIGCHSIAIPYDITKISLLADALDSSWHRMLLISDRLTKARAVAIRTRLRRQLIGKVRDEIDHAGAGPRNPEFRQIRKRER